jgi:hypothetical protein
MASQLFGPHVTLDRRVRGAAVGNKLALGFQPVRACGSSLLNLAQIELRDRIGPGLAAVASPTHPGELFLGGH